MYLGLGEIATVDANVTMTPTVWSHVAFTYAGQEMKLYVNGELASTCYPNGNDCSLFTCERFPSSSPS